jgi:hypothetical protein
VKEIIELNKQNIIPESLSDFDTEGESIQEFDYENVVGQDNLTRFDNKAKKHHHRHKNRRNNQRNQQQ